MIQSIAILRAINVGGKRKILMADLKEMFVKMGFKDVSTYIQSGNVMFSNPTKEDNIALGDRLEKAILERFKLDVPVIVRTKEEWQLAARENPFLQGENTDIERLHLTFLKEIPTQERLDKIKEFDFSPDKFSIIGTHAYVFCSGKYSDSKLSNQFFESKLKVSATTRNWKTVEKLAE
ncbi:MAG: DUF1697 domain-containing protein [Bacteroidia bacterium]|nr:DUF1697 domain-containing protein [Bacteroidia bacterium]